MCNSWHTIFVLLASKWIWFTIDGNTTLAFCNGSQQIIFSQEMISFFSPSIRLAWLFFVFRVNPLALQSDSHYKLRLLTRSCEHKRVKHASKSKNKEYKCFYLGFFFLFYVKSKTFANGVGALFSFPRFTHKHKESTFFFIAIRWRTIQQITEPLAFQMESYHFLNAFQLNALNPAQIPEFCHDRRFIPIFISVASAFVVVLSCCTVSFYYCLFHCTVSLTVDEIACEPKLPPKSCTRNTLKWKYILCSRDSDNNENVSCVWKGNKSVEQNKNQSTR